MSTRRFNNTRGIANDDVAAIAGSCLFMLVVGIASLLWWGAILFSIAYAIKWVIG